MAAIVRHSLTRILGANGAPVPGAKLFIYDDGTTTPISVYSDDGLSIPAANPIICDSAGAVPLRFIAAAIYKIVVTTAAGVSIPAYDGDDIDPGVPTNGNSVPTALNWQAGDSISTARTKLQAAAQSDMTTTQSDLATTSAWAGVNLTTKSRMATGTTAQQPSAGTAGSYRWDTDFDQPVVDDGAAWKKVAIEGKWAPSYASTGSGVYCLGRSRVNITAAQTIAASIPPDNTIPQIGEGTQVTGSAINYTPKNASSSIRVRAVIHFGSNSANGIIVFAMFANSVADAVSSFAWYPNVVAIKDDVAFMDHEYSPGTTSQQSFEVRGGTNSGNLYINSDFNTLTLGATRISSVVVEEWLTP